ncbi:MAG TPA: hypothetical protein PK236_15770 [Verrucomicrobiota bacterium]|jgi:hypothetical protein|nr:hypothetical protein [Verrucomicrobiota bacterium]
MFGFGAANSAAAVSTQVAKRMHCFRILITLQMLANDHAELVPAACQSKPMINAP